jgi:DNA modification methylase
VVAGEGQGSKAMLDPNRIYEGDCMAYMKLMPDKSVDLCITDPPYGINFQSSRKIETDRFAILEGDGEVNTAFLSEVYRLLKDGCAAYIFTRWDVYPQWLAAITSVGLEVKNCIIWDRVVHGLGDLEGSYAPQYDMIIFATKGRHILKGNRPKDVIKVQRIDAEKLLHPTQKPVGLIWQLLRASSSPGELVLDPYMGSGTTAVACKQLGRSFIGMEIDPTFCKVAENRLKQVNLSNFFGEENTHA